MAHFKATILVLLALSTSLGCERPREFTGDTITAPPDSTLMTIPYTPTPAPLPATIDLPQDVVDDVIVGTVNPPFQKLADAAAYQNLLDAAEYTFSAGVTPDATQINMVAGSYVGTGYTLAAGRVTPAPGVYRVSIRANVQIDEVSSPQFCEILLLNGSNAASAQGYRYSTFVANPIIIYGENIVEVTSGDFFVRTGTDFFAVNGGRVLFQRIK